MANKKLLTNVIALLPLAAGLAALCFAPEEIPLGFDSSGAPDEWGSRWTLLPWPLVVLALRLALAGLGRLVALDKDGALGCVHGHGSLCRHGIFRNYSVIQACRAYDTGAGYVAERPPGAHLPARIGACGGCFS